MKKFIILILVSLILLTLIGCVEDAAKHIFGEDFMQTHSHETTTHFEREFRYLSSDTKVLIVMEKDTSVADGGLSRIYKKASLEQAEIEIFQRGLYRIVYKDGLATKKNLTEPSRSIEDELQKGESLYRLIMARAE